MWGCQGAPLDAVGTLGLVPRELSKGHCRISTIFGHLTIVLRDLAADSGHEDHYHTAAGHVPFLAALMARCQGSAANTAR